MNGPDLDVQDVFRERRRALERRATRARDEVVLPTERVLVVRAGDGLFGIPLVGLFGVRPTPVIRSLPGAPAQVRGVAFVQGRFRKVLDPFSTREGKYLVLLRDRDASAALIDAAAGTVTVPSVDLEAVRTGDTSRRLWTAPDGALITLINPETLPSTELDHGGK